MTESSVFVPKHIREEQARDAVAAAAATAEEKKAVDLKDAYSRLDPEKLDQDEIDRLPTPSGWRIMVLPYAGKKQTDGGIYIPEQVQEQNSRTTVVGYVVSMGSDAYADKAKFPTGPWCKKGDWIVFGRYAGARFKIDGGELRLLNDDEILAVLSDPDAISHV
jgi:co-chaperonin GroES (HSP10)